MGEGLAIIYISCSIESENTMLSDLLDKIDDVKKYIPDEIFPELVVPMIVPSQRQTSSEVYVFCRLDYFDKSE